MENNEKYKGRVVAISAYSVPGAWDNWALPEYSYSGVALMENGELESFHAGYSDSPKPEPDASPELMAQYEAILAKKDAERRAQLAEKERNSPAFGKKMQVLKGKNKGFVGIVKWVGESRYGKSALLINEAGEKVFTKPHNLLLIEEAQPEEPSKVVVGAKVVVKMGQNAGVAGTVQWMGETRYGYKAKVQTSSGVVWAKPANLEVSDESEVKALIA